MAERGAVPQVPRARKRALRVVRSLFSRLLPDDYLELVNPPVFIRPGYDWPGHKAGQYTRVGVVVDGVFHWRAYSLTSEPDHPKGYIAITPKRFDAGVVSPYAEIAPRVKDICERYGLPYNIGPFSQLLGMVQRSILRLAFPGGSPQPKPGPYHGGDEGQAAQTNGRPVGLAAEA